jgi:hypothetical protein
VKLLTGLAYFAVVPTLTVAPDRFHVPIAPLVALFAAFALTGFLRPRPMGAPA